jgi:multicomponent Na+:H+ antiporter subunit E
VGVVPVIVRASGFAILWAILGGGTGWGIGIPVIVIATVASPRVSPSRRWSVAGLARFLPYFIWNSLLGGFDVAARALNPALPVDPALLRYEMRLETTTARVLMANTVTLLPGTLSADLQGNVLQVHVLNASGAVTDMLDKLERRVGDLVRQPLEAKPR